MNTALKSSTHSEHIVYVDSNSRNKDLYPNSNEFKVYLETPLRNVLGAKLNNAQIPFLINNIKADVNNKISFTERLINSTVSSFDIVLRSGFYSELTLANEIQRILNANKSGTGEYIVSYIDFNHKYMTSYNGTDLASFEFDASTQTANALYKNMGFSNASIYRNTDSYLTSETPDPYYTGTSANAYADAPILSDTFINLTGNNRIVLSIEELNVSGVHTTYKKNTGQNLESHSYNKGSFITFTSDDIGGSYLTVRPEDAITRTFPSRIEKIETLTIRIIDAETSDLATTQDLAVNLELIFNCASGSAPNGSDIVSFSI